MEATARRHVPHRRWSDGADRSEGIEEDTMMGYGYGHDGWWNTGMVFMGVFWVLLLAVVIWAVLRLGRHPTAPAGAAIESPRHILDRRFARGEIDEAHYAQARRVLDGRGVENTGGEQPRL
jgi:putative membrane protein